MNYATAKYRICLDNGLPKHKLQLFAIPELHHYRICIAIKIQLTKFPNCFANFHKFGFKNLFKNQNFSVKNSRLSGCVRTFVELPFSVIISARRNYKSIWQSETVFKQNLKLSEINWHRQTMPLLHSIRLNHLSLHSKRLKFGVKCQASLAFDHFQSATGSLWIHLHAPPATPA